MKAFAIKGFSRILATAISVGIAAWSGGVACTRNIPAGSEPRAHRMAPPSADEAYCAWFADSRDDVLYFGMSAFWSTFRAAGGDPRADLATPGPQWIGRFDLATETPLPPIDLGPPRSAAGPWDVLAGPDRVYFSDYFGISGYTEPATGRTVRFEGLGAGLNEWAWGPDGSILVTRYGYGSGSDGAAEIVVLEPDGTLRAQLRLDGPEGFHPAPKSLAWDPVRREIWVNTDLLLDSDAAHHAVEDVQHDTRVLDEGGRERARFTDPQVHFMRFGPDGTGYFAEVQGSLLHLRVRSAEQAASSPVLTGLRIPLDDAFSAEADFVQDIQIGQDGTAIVTRWSGKIHLVARDGGVRTLELPRGSGDLYYTAVLRKGRVCATRCGDLAVVCRDADG